MKGKSSALSLVIALAAIFAVLISAQEHKSAVRIPLCEYPLSPSVRIPCEEPPLNLPECSPCTLGSDCAQGKCWGSPRRCTDGSYPSLKRCFKDECEHCTASGQCATKKCWGGKCVFDHTQSLLRCGFKAECAVCTSGSQCSTKKCWGPGAVLKCTFNTMESKRKCFPGWDPIDPCFNLRIGQLCP